MTRNAAAVERHEGTAPAAAAMQVLDLIGSSWMSQAIATAAELRLPDLIGDAKAVIESMKARGAAVPIPEDVVVAKTFVADAPATVKAATDVADDDLILDIGPKTAAKLAEQLMSAGTVV